MVDEMIRVLMAWSPFQGPF